MGVEPTFEYIQNKIIEKIRNAKYTIWISVAWLKIKISDTYIRAFTEYSPARTIPSASDILATNILSTIL